MQDPIYFFFHCMVSGYPFALYGVCVMLVTNNLASMNILRMSQSFSNNGFMLLKPKALLLFQLKTCDQCDGVGTKIAFSSPGIRLRGDLQALAAEVALATCTSCQMISCGNDSLLKVQI